MKKHGFTLAEILITMGIIGVVAALAAPALIAGSSKAKIGPTLSKFVSTFESAAELLLNDEEASSLVGLVGYNSEELGKSLSRYMKLDNKTSDETFLGATYHNFDKGTSFSLEQGGGGGEDLAADAVFMTDDGALIYIACPGPLSRDPNYADIPNNLPIGNLYIDINGLHAPNTIAKDIFKFSLYDDGTLRPWGSKNTYHRVSYSGGTYNFHWDQDGRRCNSNAVDTTNRAWTCTGSIFDNNMKVIYK